MTTDSFLALTCTSTLGLLYGFILAFAGYRFFLFLLPFWGFFWGFGLGAQSIQAIFNEGFLTSVSSWVVGFFVGLLFAVVSYFFFAAAVAILSGSLGYSLGVGIMLALGFDMGVLTWIVGIALAIAFIAAVFYFDLYKWAIMIATAILGAGTVVGVFLFLFGKLPAAQFVQNPVKAALNDSPLWWIVAIAVAILGLMTQYATTRNWTLRAYSRWDEVYPSSTTPPETVLAASSAPMSAGLTPAAAGAAPSGATMPAPPPAPSVDVTPTQDTPSEPPGGTA